MGAVNEVVLTKRAQKQIRKIPRHIVVKLSPGQRRLSFRASKRYAGFPGFMTSHF